MEARKKLKRYVTVCGVIAATSAAITVAAVASGSDKTDPIEALPTGKTDATQVAEGTTATGRSYVLTARGSDNGLCLQVAIDVTSLVHEACGFGVPTARDFAVVATEHNDLGERVVYGPASARVDEVTVAMEGAGSKTVSAKSAYGNVGAYLASFPDRAEPSEITVTARNMAGKVLDVQRVSLLGNSLPGPK